MRRFTVAIAGLCAGLLVAIAPSGAQEPVRDVQTAPQAWPDFYAPLVWNGNALGAVQEIYAEQGRALPPGIELPSAGQVVWTDALVEVA